MPFLFLAMSGRCCPLIIEEWVPAYIGSIRWADTPHRACSWPWAKGPTRP